MWRILWQPCLVSFLVDRYYHPSLPLNDLPKVSNLKVRLFADDAILTLSDKDEKNLQHIMNDQLTKIDD